MTPTHATKQGRRYRYYVSTTQQEGHHTEGTMRIPAGEIEGLVLDRLRALLVSRSEAAAALSLLELDAAALNHALRRAVELGARWTTAQPNEQRQLIRTVIEGVVVKPDRIEISIRTVALAKVLDGRPTVSFKAVAPVTLSVEAHLRRVGKGQRIIIEGNTPHSANDGLVRLLQEAFSARAGLLGDSDETLNAMTARLGLAKGHLTWLMRLTYLSPDIISAIVAGNQPVGLTPRRLLRLSQDLPHAWSEQRAYLGFKD